MVYLIGSGQLRRLSHCCVQTLLHEVDPPHRRVALVVAAYLLLQGTVVEVVGELIDSATLNQPQLDLPAAPGVENVLRGEYDPFEKLGQPGESGGAELFELLVVVDHAHIVLLQH